MVDLPVTDRSSRWRSPAAGLKLWHMLVLALLILVTCCAVRDLTTDDRCKTTLGRASTFFKLDAYFSNCQCMTHSLDFRDSCNSGYIALGL